MIHIDHEVDQPNQAAKVQNDQLKVKTVMAHESFVHSLMPDTAYVETNVEYDTAQRTHVTLLQSNGRLQQHRLAAHRRQVLDHENETVVEAIGATGVET